MFALVLPNGEALKFEMVDHPEDARFKALKLASGEFICITPDNLLERRPTARSWEQFSVAENSALLVGEREGRVFVRPFVKW